MPTSAEHWKQADQAYIDHHFACPTCCAAGASSGKQSRCPKGLQLWKEYNNAGLPPHLQSQPSTRPPPPVFRKRN